MKKILAILVMLLVLALLAVVIVPRLGQDRPAEQSVPAAEPAFTLSSEDGELLEELAARRPDRNVVVIGLDGTSWNLLDPMIERGQLPTFKRLMETGTYGDLRSIVFQVTPPAWTAMFSGCLPWQTGIYGFGKLDTASWAMEPVSSRDVRVPLVWDMTSQAGLKTAVINVPVTYPAKPVNGIMVSGMLTPDLVLLKRITVSTGGITDAARREFDAFGLKSFSPPRKAEVSVHGNPVTVFLIDDADDNVSEYTTSLVVVEEFTVPGAPDGGDASTVVPFQAASCPLTQYTPWLKIRAENDGSPQIGWVRLSPERVGTGLIKMTCTPIYGNVAHSTVNFCYPDSFRKAIAARFERFIPFVSYVIPTIPDIVDDLAEHVDFYYRYDDWNLFIYQFQVTDVIGHWDGADEHTQDVYMRLDRFLGNFIAGLPDNTVVIIASDHGQRDYRFKVNLNVWMDKLHLLARDRTGGLDTKNSIAFHMYWGIYINEAQLKERWQVIPGFSPAEGKPLYDSFVEFLISKASQLTYPNTTRPMPVTLIRAPKRRMQPAPDLVVQPEYGQYAVHHEDIFQVGQDLILTPLQEGKKWAHRRAGMFIAAGPGIKKGYKAATQDIFDIAPTMLYILGLPLADYFDGDIMRDIFDQQFLATNRVERIHSYQFSRVETEAGADREKLEEKLRAIGYIQ